MANKFSSAFEMAVNADKGVKEVFSDFLIKVYDGTPPATADAAKSGNLLAQFTKGGATLTGTASTRQEAQVVVVRGSTGDTAIFTFSTPSVVVTYAQVAGDSTDDLLVTSICAAINADTTANKVVEAIAVVGAAVTEAIVLLRARYPGEPFVVVVTKTGTLAVTTTDITANARINTLHFDNPNADGDLVNEAAYTWNATGLVAGTATYFRVVQPTDTGVAVTITEPRIQGNIATAGAEINLQPSAQIVVGQPLTISEYKVSISRTVA